MISLPRKGRNRSFLLIYSAVILRLISGTGTLARLPNVEGESIVAS